MGPGAAVAVPPAGELRPAGGPRRRRRRVRPVGGDGGGNADADRRAAGEASLGRGEVGEDGARTPGAQRPARRQEVGLRRHEGALHGPRRLPQRRTRQAQVRKGSPRTTVESR